MVASRATWLRVAGLHVLLRGVDRLDDWPAVARGFTGFRVSGACRADFAIQLARSHPAVGVRRASQWVAVDGLGSDGAFVVEVIRSRGGLRLRVHTHTAVAVVATLHVGLAFALGERDGLLLHASAARVSGGVVVFPGRSGAGKTTAVRSFGKDRFLCDERVAVRRTPRGWRAYSVPLWGGKYGRVSPGVRDVVALVLIRKGAPLGVHAVSPLQALRGLVPAIKRHQDDSASADVVLGSLGRLVGAVPVLRLTCRREDPIAAVLDGFLARR